MEDTDNTTTNDQVSVDQEKAKNEEVSKEVDLKREMEKAIELAKKNPIQAGKSMFICWGKACSFACFFVPPSLLAWTGRVKFPDGIHVGDGKNLATDQLSSVSNACICAN